MNSCRSVFTVIILLVSVSVFAEAPMTVDLPVEDYYSLPDYHPARIREVTGESDALWDIVFAYDCSSLTGSVYIVGVEFDGSSFWVTSGGYDYGYKKLYQINQAFTTILSSINQPTGTSHWGWRDLAYDHNNNYLYVGDETTDPYSFARIDLNTVPPTMTELTDPSIGELTCLRGMCFDPNTGHIWTCTFSSGIYEIDTNGTLIFADNDSEVTSLSKYGLAWDDVTAGGPYIWISCGSSTNPSPIWQYDVTNHTILGQAGGISPLLGNSYCYGGGLFFDEFGVLNPGYATLGGLQQGDNDVVFGVEFEQISTPTPSATPTESPTPTVTPTPTPTGTPPPLPALGVSGILLLLLSLSGLMVWRTRR